MDQKMKQRLIIAGIAFVAIFGILTIFALTSSNNDGATKQEVEGTVETDPVSGEKIVMDSHQSQTSAGSTDSDRPAMLGFGKLADYGMAAGQREQVQQKLTDFAKAQDPKITMLSFYKDSYRQQLPDANGISHMTFDVQANQKTDYYVDVAYSGTDDATVSVYEKDKTTLIFSE